MNFELPEKYKKEKLVLCSTDNPSPIAYMNIYEEGDVWLKIKGCEGCKNNKKCCGDCPMSTDLGCFYHLGANKKTSRKPFYCVFFPTPNKTISWCQLEYKCIVGTHKDEIRQIKKPGNVFKKK